MINKQMIKLLNSKSVYLIILIKLKHINGDMI